jgi:hypothetical protein
MFLVTFAVIAYDNGSVRIRLAGVFMCAYL